MTSTARKDEATIYHDNLVVVLKPTLRAALALVDRAEGWQPLFRRVDQFDTATICEIIRVFALDRSAAESLIAAFGILPISKIRKAVSGPLGELLSLFVTPFDDDNEDSADDETVRSATPLTWPDVYLQLFEIGTGWIGWTPAETWASTPAEINLALRGHVGKLNAMNGQSEPKRKEPTREQRQANVAAGLDPDFDRDGLERLRSMR